MAQSTKTIPIEKGSGALFAAAQRWGGQAGVVGKRTVCTSARAVLPKPVTPNTVSDAIRRCARCGTQNYMAMHSPGCPNRTKTVS